MFATGRDINHVSVHREIAREEKIKNVIDAIHTLSEFENVPADILIDAGMLIGKIETFAHDKSTRGIGRFG